MICPKCGTDNKKGFTFCVACGHNLNDLSDININQLGQLSQRGYRSENDGSNFTIGSGTFIINDKAPETKSSLFTADELNESYDDYNEPYIPQLNTEHIIVPDTSAPMQQQFHQQPAVNQFHNSQYPSQQYNNQNNYSNFTPNYQTGGPQVNKPQMINQQFPNPHQQVQNIPQPAPYPQNNMYANQAPTEQSQLIGYDLNGMPIYAPQSCVQQKLIGYDLNGMPIYASVMTNFPQQNPNMFMQNEAYPQQVPNNMGISQGSAPHQMVQPAQFQQNQANTPTYNDYEDDDDDGDFFNRPASGKSGDMNNVSSDEMDFSLLEKRFKRKTNHYMTTAPQANAEDLSPNVPADKNRIYMKATDIVDADDLEENVIERSKVKMHVTDTANADDLEEYIKKPNRVVMRHADTANADELESYEHEHVEALMSNADHPVEAMPKKKEVIDEIDAIVIPEYMQAKKTVRTQEEEVPPSIPEL